MVRHDSIRVVVRGLEDVVSRKVKQITLHVQANLIEATPRDTSWAANNWIISIGAGSAEPAGSPERVGEARAAAQSGVARLVGYRLGQPNPHITNNVPYILFLNNGSSMQAPARFVEAAILRGIREVAVLP